MAMHTLRITREHAAVKRLRKDARALAMTGGFEIELDSGLGVGDFEALCEALLPELAGYPNDMRRHTNLVYRVLDLIRKDARCPEALRGHLHQGLSD